MSRRFRNFRRFTLKHPVRSLLMLWAIGWMVAWVAAGDRGWVWNRWTSVPAYCLSVSRGEICYRFWPGRPPQQEREDRWAVCLGNQIGFYYGGSYEPPGTILIHGVYYEALAQIWLIVAILGLPWLLAAFRALRAPPGSVLACRKCEYDLTGNVSGVCPECGESVPFRTLENLIAE
ncbi:MAG: hypothetical protein HZB38_00935 [Planctomycetes bacterium]|nr:hypothetical protein [Planctomycetota bacterium]